eukprot:m.1107754 g.1107754  ORF g.1107754 m.1107754 type:complete len:53 (+) comp24350_c0_seq20:5298-5456(+)
MTLFSAWCNLILTLIPRLQADATACHRMHVDWVCVPVSQLPLRDLGIDVSDK